MQDETYYPLGETEHFTPGARWYVVRFRFGKEPFEEWDSVLDAALAEDVLEGDHYALLLARPETAYLLSTSRDLAIDVLPEDRCPAAAEAVWARMHADALDVGVDLASLMPAAAWKNAIAARLRRGFPTRVYPTFSDTPRKQR